MNEMMRGVRLTRWVVLLAATGTFGCATRDQFLQLRREVGEVRRVLADTQSDMQAQQRQIQALSGESDTLRHTSIAEGPSVEDRLSALEATVEGRGGADVAGAASGGMPAAGETPAEAPAAEPPPPSGGEVAGQELAALHGARPEEDEYRMALALVEQKNCDEAIPRLRSYLRKYPDTDLSDNAQYWIGECYYAQRDFNNAILAFYDVTRRYPKGDKVCAAMLKQGFAFAELGDAADARIVLERLVQTYPSCDEASRAKVKLSGLQSG